MGGFRIKTISQIRQPHQLCKIRRGRFLICSCGVYGVFVRAVTVLCIAPFHSAAKTPPALFHRSYRCYIYATQLGSVSRNYRNVVCPTALNGLKNLKGVKLGAGQKPAVMFVCRFFSTLVHVFFCSLCYCA